MKIRGPLLFLAGRSAYRQIMENGLSQSDVRAVLGASGAAKWLIMYGLDSLLFSQWFAGRTTPLHLFGTSIGAWKFAAAAQSSPCDAFDRLRDGYIHQYYGDRLSLARIAWETDRISRYFLPDREIDNVLSHPFLRMGFSAVRCKGLMTCHDRLLQGIGVASAHTLNFVSRRFNPLSFRRTFFHHPDYDPDILRMDDFSTDRVELTRENFGKALLASGSIPMIMKGVRNIPSASRGTYRDGGLLDYHPVFPLGKGDGIILYPHFYPKIILGWFDKSLPKRQPSASAVDNILLLAPSPEFVASLPFGRIPDRKDFIRLKGRDGERVRFWKTAAQMSETLGHAFADAVDTGKIKQLVQPFDSYSFSENT